MRSKIAIFGGSFNPPGIHHRVVAEALARHFDRVIVLPCGMRSGQSMTNDVDPWHRAALTDIAFRGAPKVEVELSDLELANFTTNDRLEERYSASGEVWHVVGAELVEGGARGQSAIQRTWERGAEVWKSLNFCVIAQPGQKIPTDDLPPKQVTIHLDAPSTGTSAEIRDRIFHRTPYASMVSPEVMAYIERYGLYRGRIPSRRTRWSLKQPRLLIEADDRNPRAMALANDYRGWQDDEDPNCILVLGGDGMMLHAIRRHWRRRIPFLGVNQGTVGFLLNEPPSLFPGNLSQTELIVRQMPMIYLEVEGPDGQRKSALGFNDAWVERSTSQSAWMEVELNGQVRIPRLVADGALVCTAAGSTAYARAMGVLPLLADTPGWILVGSNVMNPAGWKSALLAPEATVSLRSVGGEKRPINAFVDGRDLGPAASFHSRLSRIASVELAFVKRHDMAEKIARIQFPSVDG